MNFVRSVYYTLVANTCARQGVRLIAAIERRAAGGLQGGWRGRRERRELFLRGKMGTGLFAFNSAEVI